ncbi:sensor histidine kinase [Streptomyces sp. NPDC019531]|uniref:sensor histidine kinase n=1 Tax=Streptomyces sp. NPDC019531 TaxID=3365062 RepID=UPI00384FD6CA
MRMRTPRPLVVDTLLALATAWAAVRLGQRSVSPGWPELDAGAYALIGLIHLPVALRSRAPLVVFALVQCAGAVYITLGYWPLMSAFGSMLVLYTVASMRPARTAVGCAAVMTVVWIYASAINDRMTLGSAVNQALLYCSMLVWLGTRVRLSSEISQTLRVRQAERTRREVTEERARIARELHDVVAPHMSVISVQAGLARFVVHSDTATAHNALRIIEDTSGEALEELRRVLQILRHDEVGGTECAAPMPTLARLGDLVERIQAGGVPVDLHVEGTVRPLAPGVELCAYRVVQEALTNVLKHTDHALVRVRLHYRQDELSVSVTDDGHGATSGRVPEKRGHGLMGMRERVKLYGGTISAGPHDGGGFAVRLTLPTPAAAAAAARWGDDDTR